MAMRNDMKRLPVLSLVCFVLFLYSTSSQLAAQLAPQAAAQTQVAGQNVNMVSGTVWPAGDQFLQRQNEPSMAVSNRNPEHLLAGANDYRTVDIADPGAADYRGDAWLGVFTSIDGGDSWKSTPLPGYPQDKSPTGTASPLSQTYQVATDPTVRAGTDGLIYYSGLAFNRGSRSGSAVFVSTFQDVNNKGNGNGAFQQSPNSSGSPFLYLNTVIVDTTSNQFVDKPWIAVDIPRPGRTATCTVNGQTFSSGYVYLFYTFFNGSTKNPGAKINVAVSTNCGASWSKPQTISQSFQLNQGTVAAIDPGTGNVYVSWRQEGNGKNQSDQILFAYSTDGGGSWTTSVVYTFPDSTATAGAFDLDENTSGTQFRGEDIPSLAVDQYGRVWVAFSQRVAVNGPSGSLPSSRIYITTMPRGGGQRSWTTPYPVDASAQGYGHQLMPSLTFGYGRLMLVWLDTRWDNQQEYLSGCTSASTCTIAHSPIPNSFLAAGHPENVFTSTITDPIGGGIRHTVDVFGSMIMPTSTFNSPTVQALQISQYKFYFNTADQQFEQANFNPPNLPMFVQGTQPFVGDYLDVAAVSMVPSGNSWIFNTDTSNAPVFHVTWTDNRDVVPPPVTGNPGNQKQDWTQYSPPGASSSSPSIFNPTAMESNCEPGYSGDRNQNVYTSRISSGLIVRFKENAKPLTSAVTGKSVQRSFSLYVRNTVSALTNPNPALYRILIGPSSTNTSSIPPPSCSSAIAGGGMAIFGDGSCMLDVAIPPRTTISRAIVVNSANTNASVSVLVAPIDAIGGSFTGGVQATAALNNFPNNPGVISDPDQITFDPSDPDFGSPYGGLITLANGEVYDPTSAGSLLECPAGAINCQSSPSISSPSISSPSIASPSIASPSIASPSIASPSIASPSITAVQTASPSIVTVPNSSPSISSPSIASPSIANLENSSPSIANPGDSATDYSFTITNKGNTTGTYNAKEFVKQMGAGGACSNSNCQLIIHRTHGNPTAAIDTNTGQAACQLAVQVQDLTQANIPTPSFTTSTSSDVTSSASNATITLGPGEGTRVTLRVFGATIDKTTTTFPIRSVAVGSVPDFNGANPTSLTIVSADLPVAVVTQPYTTNGMTGGSPVNLMSVGGVGGTEWFPFNDMPTPEPQPLGVPGFSLSPSGLISADTGVVTAPVGPYPVNVEVQDSATPVNNDTQTLTLDVNQFSITRVDVVIGNAAGGTSYLKAGDIATVTVNVSNQGPATAIVPAGMTTLTVNTLPGGTPSGSTPNVSCQPLTLTDVPIPSGPAYPFIFTCTTVSGNGYVSFTGNSTGNYLSPGKLYTTVATAAPVTNPMPLAGNTVPNSTPPDVIVDTVNPKLAWIGPTSAPSGTDPSGNQWYNTPVTETYSTSDNLSGVKQRDPISPATTADFGNTQAVQLATEGKGITGQVKVTDNALNVALPGTADSPTSPPFNIDRTAPTINAAPDRAPNGAGWYNKPVTVTFTCADPTPAAPPANLLSLGAVAQASGLKSCTSPITLSTDGRGQEADGSSSDYAANINNASVTGINIDQTPPTLVYGAQSPAANQYGWNNTNVTFSYTPADNLSGVDNTLTPPSPAIVSTEGASQSVSVTVFDIAGNSATFPTPRVKIDKTSPVIAPPTAITGGGNAYTPTMWTNQNVIVTFSCSDNLSGPLVTNGITNPIITGLPAMGATVTYQQPDTLHSIATVTLTAETTTSGATLAANCQDFAGNNAQQQMFGPVLIDKTPPTLTFGAITPASNANGWNNTTPVTISYTTADNLSGVASSLPASALVFSTEGANETTTVTVTDVAGNVAKFTSPAVNIDTTKPVVGIAAPVAGQIFLLNSTITPMYTCTDASFDSVTCAFTPSPAAYAATSVGPGTYSVSALDLAGNANIASVNYLVAYNFTGFQAPLQTAGPPNLPSNSGAFGDGSQIPVHFQLQDATGTFITDPAALSTIQAYSNSKCSGAPDGAAIPLFSGGSPSGSSTFEVSGNVYSFVWDTSGISAACYNVVVTLNDTTQHATIVNLVMSGASTSFVDGIFSDANWTSAKAFDSTPSAAATFTASQVASGGNPGEYRQVTMTLGQGTIIVGHLNPMAVYMPSTQGPIGSISYSYDVREFNPPFPGAAVNYALLLLQNGTYYVPTSTDTFSNTDTWVNVGNTNLTATQFSNLYQGVWQLPGTGPTHPDFSASGAPITLGYFSANTNTGVSPISTSSGIDNWSVSVAPFMDVSGTNITGFYSISGAFSSAPTDLSTTTIAAYVPNGVGGFSSIPGIGKSDGTFSIPHVPAGYYWLQLGDQGLWTSEAIIDAGTTSEGRANAVHANTTVNFSVSGMTPWQSLDSLEYWTPNVYETDQDIGTSPTAGATAYTDTVPLQGLIDTTQGDEFFLMHLGEGTIGNYTTDALEDIFSPSGTITETANSTNNFSGTFTNLQQTNALDVAIDGSQFAQFTNAAGPGATLDFSIFGVYLLTPAPELLFGNIDPAIFELFRTDQGGISSDIDLGNAQYGDPFPAAFVRYYGYQQSYRVTFMSPGATLPATIIPQTTVATLSAPTSAAPVTPVVGPVSSVAINGNPFTQPLSGVGTTPTITWQPPTVGSATDYAVVIWQLGVNSNKGSTRTRVARLSTASTTIQLPPGILAPGSTYLLVITALHRAGEDPQANIFKTKFPYGTSQIVTSQFTP